MCKGFGATLAGPALQWFICLPKGSIDSFVELHQQFSNQLSSSQMIEKHLDDLYAIIQGECMSLRSYI